MIDDNLFSSIFWTYFSYVLSFVIPLFCGITLLLLKGESYNKEAGMHPRRILGIIFTLTGLLFILNMTQGISKYTTGELGIPALNITIDLLLIPSYFFYFRKMTRPERLVPSKIWLHIFPAITVFTCALFILPLLEKSTPYQHDSSTGNSPATIFHYSCLAIQTIIIIGYSTRILWLKRQHVMALKENYSFTENIDLKWLNQAIPIAVLYALTALLASARQTQWSDHLFHVCSIIFVAYLFIHALNEPYIYYTFQHKQDMEETSCLTPQNICTPPIMANIPTTDEIPSVFPALPEKYLKNLGEKREKMREELIRIFDENEIYTNGALTINDVANLLRTNRTYISNVINNEFGFSFYQFVNKYRIQKATILLLEHPEMQIQEIASLSGFNSLSSFISAFKLNEGITPKQWKQRYTST